MRFAGRGKTFAQDILASSKNLDAAVGKSAMVLKGVLADRAGLDPHVFTPLGAAFVGILPFRSNILYHSYLYRTR